MYKNGFATTSLNVKCNLGCVHVLGNFATTLSIYKIYDIKGVSGPCV